MTKNRHGAIELDWAEGTYTFRLGLEEIEELEAKRDAGLFALCARLDPRIRTARLSDITETIRCGLIGGGLKPVEALKLVRRYADERPIDENRDIAYAIVAAGLARVHADAIRADADPSNDPAEDQERLDFGQIAANCAAMGITDWQSLSLGQYAALCASWNRAHGKINPPTEAEFDLAVMRAEGTA